MHRDEAEQISFKYKDVVDVYDPHQGVESVFRYLSRSLLTASELKDLRALARYIVSNSDDEDLKSDAGWFL